MDADIKLQVKRARGRFAAMAATYGMGVFNDSFFRQSAIFLAIACKKTGLEGWIMSLFTLPYLVSAAYAGWLADRFSKRRVVIGAKFMELAAMLMGAYGIMSDNWVFILMMAFTMGWQSCLFSPALNGSIPEIYPACYVNRANSFLKVIVTGMILAGVSVSGVAISAGGTGPLEIPLGRFIVGVGVITVSLIGLVTSFFVTSKPAADPDVKFPWMGPLDTVRPIVKIFGDRLLWYVMLADMFVWFAGSMIVLLLSQMAKTQFEWGEAVGGYVIAVELIGLAIGGLLSNILTRNKKWYRLLGPFALTMGLLLVCCQVLPQVPQEFRKAAAFALFGAVGVLGGLYMIPCEAFIQVRPAQKCKGTVIATANFAVFVGIFLSGPIEVLMIRFFTPTGAMAVIGLLGIAVGLFISIKLFKTVDTQKEFEL